MPLSLVTGASGFLGSHVVEVLTEAGHRVRSTDLPRVCAKGEAVGADLTDPGTLLGLLDGVDYVFHVAAVFSYSAPWEVLYKVNCEGTRNLCEAAVAAGTVRRVVAWGAGGIYGIPRAGDLPFTERSEVRPPNAYQRSKWEQERVLQRYREERGLSFSVLRPVTPYGPRAVYGSGRLLMDLARMRRPAIPSNFTARIPFAHARDVARAALHLATHQAADGEAYNVVDDIPLPAVDLVRCIAEHLGRRPMILPPVPFPLVRGLLHVAATFGAFERPLIPYLGRDLAYSNARLKATGFSFLYPDPCPGIAETIDWYGREGWLDRR